MAQTRESGLQLLQLQYFLILPTGSVEMFHKIRSFIHEAVEAVSFLIFTIYSDHSLKFYSLDLSCEDFLTAISCYNKHFSLLLMSLYKKRLYSIGKLSLIILQRPQVTLKSMLLCRTSTCSLFCVYLHMLTCLIGLPMHINFVSGR